MSRANQQTTNPAKQEKVLMLVLNLQVGGLERMVTNLAQQLSSEGHFVQVCCIRPDIGPLANGLVESGIPVVTLDSSAGLSFSIARKLRKILLNGEFTVLHSHNASALTYGAMSSAWISGLRHVNTKHGSEQKNWRSNIRNGLSHLATHSIVAVSAELEEQIEAEPFSKGKVQLINNGVPDPWTSAPDNKTSDRHFNREAPHLGHIARLHPHKNQLLLLDAFAAFVAKIPAARLSIVGDGDERQRLETRCRELDMIKSVSFLGLRSDITELIETFDWVVFTSKSEGTPMVAVEAFAAAKPITSTPVGGMVDMIEDDKSGYLSSDSTVDAVVKSWQRMIDNSDRYPEMCGAARLFYEQGYSVTQMARSYLRAYVGSH